MYIKVAVRDPDRPRINGYPLDPLLSQPDEQLVKLVIGQSRGTLHNDGPLLPGSRGCFFYTHDTPQGQAITYRPPEMTQDTPRITFLGRVKIWQSNLDGGQEHLFVCRLKMKDPADWPAIRKVIQGVVLKE